MSSSSRHLPCSQSSLKIPCRKHDSLITVTSCWTWSNVKFTPSKIEKKKNSKYKFTNLTQAIAHFPLFVKWWKIHMHPICYELQVSSTDWGGGGPNLTLYQHLRTLVVFWFQRDSVFLYKGGGVREQSSKDPSPFSQLYIYAFDHTCFTYPVVIKASS